MEQNNTTNNEYDFAPLMRKIYRFEIIVDDTMYEFYAKDEQSVLDKLKESGVTGKPFIFAGETGLDDLENLSIRQVYRLLEKDYTVIQIKTLDECLPEMLSIVLNKDDVTITGDHNLG